MKAGICMFMSATGYNVSEGPLIQINGDMCQQTRTRQIMPRVSFPQPTYKTKIGGPKFLLMPEPGTSESTYNLVDPSSDPDLCLLVFT